MYQYGQKHIAIRIAGPLYCNFRVGAGEIKIDMQIKYSSKLKQLENLGRKFSKLTDFPECTGIFKSI